MYRVDDMGDRLEQVQDSIADFMSRRADEIGQIDQLVVDLNNTLTGQPVYRATAALLELAAMHWLTPDDGNDVHLGMRVRMAEIVFEQVLREVIAAKLRPELTH